MTEIKDLKEGDVFTGKLNEEEFTVEGGVVNVSWAKVEGLSGNLEAIDAEIARLDNDIAHRQQMRALRVRMRDALTAK